MRGTLKVTARPFSSIETLHNDYRSGQCSVREVIESYFLRMKSKRALGAYISELEQSALSRADQLDSQLQESSLDMLVSKQPLWGVPVAIKDNLHIRDEITTCGSKILENYRAPFDATSVSLMRDAGSIFLGKANLDEFAMGGSGENSAFGPTLHPFSEAHIPGGSSSGSACAVAADLAVISLGSDTGGSIRLPASFCGIVGLKPTYGRVSRYGLVAFGSSLDQVGPLARNMNDLITAYEVIHGHDVKDSTSAPTPKTKIHRQSALQKRRVRIGIPEEFFVEGVDSSVRAALEKTIQSLKDRGAETIPISLPHCSSAIPVYYVIAMAEASSNLSRYDGVRFGVRPEEASFASSLEGFYSGARALFGKEVKRRILLGSFVLSAGYHDAYYRKACQVRRLIAQDFQRAFESVDIIVGPVAPGTAFLRGAHSANEETLLQVGLDVESLS
ncbi:Asp-tRNA(Asn)/Glu-tRNA(Gln) amidotransferase subunit GatA [bacterium]|nr:Asp-tRNA(Asn)/Glu-tRNA(Gln) amidotransferase subunit GatA [bacterium]